jgi:HAD superfamily, subfamily IIIB (Acid phosphatase)
MLDLGTARRAHWISISLLALALAAAMFAVPRGPAEAALPSRQVWLADVAEAMEGSQGYLDRRAQGSGSRLAVNLDIDNTAIASHYDPGDAVAEVLRFTRHARSLGYDILFNTGRKATSDLRASTLRQLNRTGYHVDELCMRRVGESIVDGKQRCRRQFESQGYTITANVGNSDTDFVGGDYERAFTLPSYDGELN